MHVCCFCFFWVEAAVFQSVWAGWLHSVCLDQNKSWWSGSLFVPQLVASSVRAWWTIGATQTHKVGLIESRAFTAGLWCWLTEDNLCLPPLGWVRWVEWTERWRGCLSRVCAWGLGGIGMCGLLVCVHDCKPSLSSFITLWASRLISVDRSGCVAASASRRTLHGLQGDCFVCQSGIFIAVFFKCPCDNSRQGSRMCESVWHHLQGWLKFIQIR